MEVFSEGICSPHSSWHTRFKAVRFHGSRFEFFVLILAKKKIATDFGDCLGHFTAFIFFRCSHNDASLVVYTSPPSECVLSYLLSCNNFHPLGNFIFFGDIMLWSRILLYIDQFIVLSILYSWSVPVEDKQFHTITLSPLNFADCIIFFLSNPESFEETQLMLILPNNSFRQTDVQSSKTLQVTPIGP